MNEPAATVRDTAIRAPTWAGLDARCEGGRACACEPSARRGAVRLALVLLGLGLLGLGLVAPSAGHAQLGQRQAATVLRILAYDRNLPRRAQGEVPIVIVYRPGDSDSESERTELARSLRALGARATVSGMRPRIVEHAYADRETLESALRSERAVALFVCQGLGAQVSDISRASRATSALSLTSTASAVRAGLGVGLISAGSQLRLTVNLPAIAAEGGRLDAAVLRLAEVIRR